jgi:CO/xanthine dehydrogenase Mo-binding subunit
VHTVAPAVPALLGTDERRIDGRIKVSGQAKYTADFSRPEMLWAAFVISPHAHARIVSIDSRAAREMSGVHAVLTGADIGERFIGVTLSDWPVLAFERVRFVGEFVAAVAAESRALAEQAAAAVDVVYEVLPAMLEPEDAIAPGAPPMHADESKFFFLHGPVRPARPHPNMQGYERVQKGDPEAALASAAHVFERTFHTPRYHAGYLEPRAALVWIDETSSGSGQAHGTVHVLTPNKNPFLLRDTFARATGLPKEQFVIEPSYIGGEFGAKALTIEEFPLYYLARATNRPVKHIRTHADDVRSTHVRHAAKIRVRIGVADDGTFVALALRVLYDGGAYGAAKPGPNVLPGRVPKIPYVLPHATVERITAYTNTIPGAFVRAPGDMQIMFAVESLVDEIAAKLGIDPIELRLRNAARAGETDIEGNAFHEPRPREVLERLRAAMGWDRPLAPGRGRGIALSARQIGSGKTGLAVTLLPNGDLAVATGSTEPGVGTHTVIQRVLAAELGLDPERVSVTRGNTSEVPFDPGIAGSRGTWLLGQASLDAARRLRAAFAEAGVSHVDWDAAARAVTRDGALRIIGSTDGPPANAPMWLNFCAYGAEVSVDRETGRLTVHDVTMVADIGTVINPIAHRGQLDGGFLMGLGHALTEELRLEDGRIVNLALSEYKLPCQLDMPAYRTIYLEPGGGGGPYGARAAGEFNVPPVAPAIANALTAACGVRLDTLPLTAERIYDALQQAG